MSARILSAAGRRVAEADIDDLAGLIALRQLVEHAITTAIGGLREAGVTWEEIGEVVGTTRQAALMRYGPRLGSSIEPTA